MVFPVNLSASTVKELYQNTSSKLEELGLTKNGKIVSETAAVKIFRPKGAAFTGFDFSEALASILAIEGEDNSPVLDNLDTNNNRSLYSK